MTATTDDPTWHEIVREVAATYGFRNVTDDHADWVLWERTSFPMGGEDRVREELQEYYYKVGSHMEQLPLEERDEGREAAPVADDDWERMKDQESVCEASS